MNRLREFRSHCKGSVAILFAVAVVPIVVGAGLAVDYARAVQRRSELQNELDGAVIALSRDTAKLTDAQILEKIQAYIEAKHKGEDPAIALHDLGITRNPPELTARLKATVPTTLMQIIGIKSVDLEVKTTASLDTADVVIVLDTSATMAGGNRLATVKHAILSFITDVGGTDNTVKIGAMPYGVGVRVPTTQEYRNANWILFTGDNLDAPPVGEDGEDGEDGIIPVDPWTWTGCLTDRRRDYDTDDTNYKALIPSGDPNKKYPALKTCRDGEANLATVFRLTSGQSGFQSLANHVANIPATTNEHANVTIGVAWGHALLTKAVEPFQEAKASDAPSHRRILILVSSGVNDRSRWWQASSVTTRARTACSAIKTRLNPNDRPIEVYTVNVSFTTAGDDLLKECASNEASFFDTASAADISNAFSHLARLVRQPRLTH